MKKKMFFITCGIVVLFIAVMVLFIFSGESNIVVENINMEGTWKVAVYTDTDTITIVDTEYMVFEKEVVNDYRNNSEIPYATSKYIIDKEGTMQLPDISKKYTIEKYTDNYVRMYESKNKYMDLIRYANKDMSSLDIDSSIMNGKWNIIYRNTSNVYAGEYMIFDNGNISHYREGSDTPVATSLYSWKNGNHLIVDTWGKDMIFYPVSDNTVIFVEISPDDGFVWEFQKGN